MLISQDLGRKEKSFDLDDSLDQGSNGGVNALLTPRDANVCLK